MLLGDSNGAYGVRNFDVGKVLAAECSGTAFVYNATSLSVARLLLGIAEAGFSTAMLFFAACWFLKRQRGMAMALMFSAICVSAILTPLLTQILGGMDGVAGIAGWRWLFILTGIPPLILAVVWCRLVRNTPGEATFLDAEEKSWLKRTLAAEDADHVAHSKNSSFVQRLMDWRVVVLTIVFLCFTFSLYGYQFWIPQIVKEFGVSNNQVGWINAVRPLLAIGPMLWWARCSDRTQNRVWHFCVAAIVAARGFAIAALFFDRPILAMVGFSIAGIGLYSSMATLMVIPSTFLRGAALAAGLAFINGTGNFGGYLGPQITGWIKESTGSFTSAVVICSIAMTAAAAIAYMFGRTHKLCRMLARRVRSSTRKTRKTRPLVAPSCVWLTGVVRKAALPLRFDPVEAGKRPYCAI